MFGTNECVRTRLIIPQVHIRPYITKSNIYMYIYIFGKQQQYTEHGAYRKHNTAAFTHTCTSFQRMRANNKPIQCLCMWNRRRRWDDYGWSFLPLEGETDWEQWGRERERVCEWKCWTGQARSITTPSEFRCGRLSWVHFHCCQSAAADGWRAPFGRRVDWEPKQNLSRPVPVITNYVHAHVHQAHRICRIMMLTISSEPLWAYIFFTFTPSQVQLNCSQSLRAKANKGAEESVSGNTRG